VLWNVLDRVAFCLDPAILAASHVIFTVKLGEAPLVGSHDLLPSREFKLGTAKSFNHVCGVVILEIVNGVIIHCGIKVVIEDKELL